MKKYSVVIPPPKAKRMMKLEKVLHVEFGDGWNWGGVNRYTVPADKFYAEFPMSDNAEYRYNTSVIDGPTFDVFVEYKNEGGTRTERKYLVPQLVA
jgi:hypothetical protein